MKLGKSFFIGVLLAFVFFAWILSLLWDNTLSFSEQNGNTQELTSEVIMKMVEDYFNIENDIEKELNIERYYCSGIRDVLLVCGGKVVSDDLDDALRALSFDWSYGRIPDYVINAFTHINSRAKGIIRDTFTIDNRKEYIWHLRIRYAVEDRPLDWGVFIIEPYSLRFLVFYAT